MKRCIVHGTFLMLSMYSGTALGQPVPPGSPPDVKSTIATEIQSVVSAVAAQAFTDPNKATSMGNSRISVFMTPIEFKAMEDTLRIYETRASDVGNVAPELDLGLEPEPEQEQIILTEPDLYPVFYLSSIVYNSPKDWSVWVSGHKITSQRNPTNLNVVSVSAERATFMWAPIYAEQIALRQKDNLFAPVDALKHRLAKAAPFSFDSAVGNVSFTLKANQSFAPAYMNIFEGYIESPKLSPLHGADKVGENANLATSPASPNAEGISGNSLPAQPTGILDKVKQSPSISIDEQLKRDEQLRKGKSS